MVSYFPSTLESIQKFKFEANKIINSKAFLCQEDISESIHEPTGPRLVDECQKLNDCETGESNVTLDCKLPVK